jgi:hypothetical protein
MILKALPSRDSNPDLQLHAGTAIQLWVALSWLECNYFALGFFLKSFSWKVFFFSFVEFKLEWGHRIVPSESDGLKVKRGGDAKNASRRPVRVFSSQMMQSNGHRHCFGIRRSWVRAPSVRNGLWLTYTYIHTYIHTYAHIPRYIAMLMFET